MIVTIQFSDKFLTDAVIKQNFNHKNFSNFIKNIIEDENIFFLGNKKHLEKQMKKYKNHLKQNSHDKYVELLIRLFQKPNWIDIKNGQDNYQDFKFISDLEKNNFKKKTLSFKKIKNNTKKILKQINKIKQEIFDLELKANNEKKKYTVNEKEMKKFNEKLLKSMILSNKIVIWDQYIPNSLAYIQNNKNYSPRIMKGKYFNDYCNTLQHLENEVFSKENKINLCEIITMNKLQENENYEKFSKEFYDITQSYINNLKLTKGKIIVKDYDPDIWVDLHSRLLIFKDEVDQLISYFIVEPGVDFIKLDNIEHYSKKSKGKILKINKFRYRFTPGNKYNFKDKIAQDLQKIHKINGFELTNFA